MEFALIAPVLFLVFFAVLQTAYTAFTALAVQRAALAVAQNASQSPNGLPSKSLVEARLIYALYPLSRLNRTTLACAFASQTQIKNEGQRVTVQIRYPMPIWVPGVGRLFGEPLIPSFDYTQTALGRQVQGLLAVFGVRLPDLSFEGLRFPYARWMTFQASTFNEGAL